MGASFQLETSGKRASGGVYRYRYYNCRTFCRVKQDPDRSMPVGVL